MTVTDPIACEGLKLVHLVRGSSTIAHKAGQFEMSAGSLALLPADDWYIGTPHCTVETLTLYLDTDYIQDQIRWLPAAAPFLEQALALSSPALLRPHPLHQPKVTRFLHAMANASKSSTDAALIQLVQLGTLHTLLEYMSVDLRSVGEPRPPPVDAATRLLCENLQDSWSIVSLAKAVALSPSQLTRLFIQRLGTSPARFLREARARRMHELLATTDLNIKEASRAVGWPDSSQGARAFRSVFGFSPHESQMNRQAIAAPRTHARRPPTHSRLE